MPETDAAMGKLAEMIADLNGYITRRAREIAEPMIEKAFAAAAEDVEAAKGETQRQQDLVTELGRRIKSLERQADQTAAARDKLATALGHRGPGHFLPGLVAEVIDVLATLKEKTDAR